MYSIHRINDSKHGNVGTTAAPKINLGTSLSRRTGQPDKPTGSTRSAIARKSVTLINKVIKARRISDIFSSLPRLSQANAAARGNGDNGRYDVGSRRLTIQQIREQRIQRILSVGAGLNRRGSHQPMVKQVNEIKHKYINSTKKNHLLSQRSLLMVC